MRHAWEDEGEQVIQLRDLLPLTFPSSPKGQGKADAVAAHKDDQALMKIPRLRHGAHIAGVAVLGGLRTERRSLRHIFRQALQFV